jgi:DNA-binding transcriptional MerR regulator
MNDLKKLYYSIGEVSAMTDLPASVLRYWETEFSQLRPPKNRAGKRVYRHADIERIQLIKKLLYRDRFTIEGARKYLKDERTAPDQTNNSQTAPVSQSIAALPTDELRRGLREILEILNR